VGKNAVKSNCTVSAHIDYLNSANENYNELEKT